MGFALINLCSLRNTTHLLEWAVMARKTKRLSEEEIWDDSALVNSWNEALEEYKVGLTPL